MAPADDEKIGKVWGDDELDLIVADYFAMLNSESLGIPYVKSHHSASLMSTIGRTHRSVEFKHMNISAVLSELGMPTIRGYKPKPNYQNAIFDAIDRYLTARPSVVLEAMPNLSGFAEAPTLFEKPPPALLVRKPRPEGLERLVRKFDPVERDFRNRALGKAGEAAVVDFERERLRNADRADLAGKVRWVSEEEGDGAGYDVHSFDLSGRDRLLEVKTTCGHSTTPFFLTRNESALAEERPEAFRLYRLYDFGRAPRLFSLEPPLVDHVMLEPETWRASFA